MTRAKVLLAAALLIGGASACSDINGNNVAADGSYFLSEVNGQRGLPYTYTDQSSGHTIQIDSDRFLLTSDGRYSETQAYRDNNVGRQANETGNWSQSSNVIYFTPDLGGDFGDIPYQATVRNDNSFGGSRTLTISISGFTQIYSD